jgi:hypothetical protein
MRASTLAGRAPTGDCAWNDELGEPDLDLASSMTGNGSISVTAEPSRDRAFAGEEAERAGRVGFLNSDASNELGGDGEGLPGLESPLPSWLCLRPRPLREGEDAAAMEGDGGAREVEAYRGDDASKVPLFLVAGLPLVGVSGLLAFLHDEVSAAAARLVGEDEPCVGDPSPDSRSKLLPICLHDSASGLLGPGPIEGVGLV